MKNTQSWTALFRAFSSHRQPSAIFSKVFPAEQTSWPNWQTLLACTEADALLGNKRFFHLWYFRNKWKSRWILEVRTAIDYPFCGSWQGFPGVDHEGHQDSTVMKNTHKNKRRKKILYTRQKQQRIPSFWFFLGICGPFWSIWTKNSRNWSSFIHHHLTSFPWLFWNRGNV